MKRVIQRKAKQSICDGSSDLGDALKKQKRASQDIGNKTRTSAAMLGLALSMGASGSILSCHSKSAMAAETKVPFRRSFEHSRARTAYSLFGKSKAKP